ncbi:MAG TPA: endonuclease domain-containing protein [Nevskiaceae bacterium]|nr:endonuclease domain-containing protein [Nevskiaceae bacterium]
MRNQGRNVDRSRRLRHELTDAERLVWSCLRDRRFLGLKFRRQFSIGIYIADFVCVESKLVVELDGGQHVLQEEYDARRSAFLEGAGYRVVRFWNHDVLRDLSVVLESLRSTALEQAALTRPFGPPSPARGRGDC